jgi:predicted ATPase
VESGVVGALGANGQLIANLIPELALVIGEQSPAVDLSPQDAKNRFQYVLRRFIGVFARPEHPLVLFLDDMQWLDTATIELVEHLVAEPDTPHLLLVGAYRDNEITASHSLMRTLKVVRNSHHVREIVLEPLPIRDVERLVAGALRATPKRVRPLAKLLWQKTLGNPFFVIQFMMTLVDEELLVFDHDTALWRWEIERIRAKGMTNNVAHLVAARLNRFPSKTLSALIAFACFGNRATAATLSLVCGSSEETMHAALFEVVRAGLVLRRGDEYVFLHDRVREAAYALLPEDSRAMEHLRIGRALTTAPADMEESVFEIVNQFNRSIVLNRPGFAEGCFV